MLVVLLTYRRHVVVRADDVEVTSREPVQHVCDGLLGGPGTFRLALSTAAVSGMHPSGTDNVNIQKQNEL
jgi:hypothetical protein